MCLPGLDEAMEKFLGSTPPDDAEEEPEPRP
jgi:hypothetical protein